MADEADREDKTEAASPQRLQRAREEGRAPLSREVAGLAVLASAAWLLSTYAPSAISRSTIALTRLLSEAPAMDVRTALGIAGGALLGVVWPFVIAAALAGATSVLVQTNFLLRVSVLRPDFGKLNPLAGLGRVFGPHNLAEAAKSTLKLAVIGAAGWHALRGAVPEVTQSLFWTPGLLATRILRALMDVVIAMLSVQGVIAAIDVLRTRLSFNASLRMTKQEQRDEARDADGDPHIKGKIKQMRMQRARRRMLQAVPSATVVVTNPTHYAVALAYDRASNGAPRIVAKGMDEMAARIRQAAKEAGVPLVANPPLARALFPLPLDAEVPAEHFKAVAELIAYVWRLKPPRRAGAGA